MAISVFVLSLLAAFGKDLACRSWLVGGKKQVVLGKILRGNEPELLALYGRRRVGKTFLIREFFREAIRFELTGIHDASPK